MARGLGIGLVTLALAAATAGGAPAAAGAGPPGAPLPVAPTDGHRFKHGEPQRFTVVALDPDLDPYTATVTVRHADTQLQMFQGETHPAPSGVAATTVAVPPLPPGRYTWSAQATDVRGATSPDSESLAFEVGPPATAGAGSITGTLEYDPPGLPRLACAATRFDLAAQASAAVFDVVVSGFAGLLSVAGFGLSSCEDAGLGAGTLTLSAHGVGPSGSRLSCNSITGPYRRVGTQLVATLSGECVVNGFDTGPLTWTVGAQTTPLSTGPGTTAPITRTRFDGAFAVRSLLDAGGGPQF